MKPIVRNMLIGLAIVGVGAFLTAKEKIETAIDTFSKIVIKPNSIPKNVSFSDKNSLGIPQRVDFKMDLFLTNPAYNELNVSGFGLATLESVDIYFKDTLLGQANLALDEITVPAKSNFILQNVPFTGQTLAILQNVQSFLEAKLSDFRFTATITALGVSYEIGT